MIYTGVFSNDLLMAVKFLNGIIRCENRRAVLSKSDYRKNQSPFLLIELLNIGGVGQDSNMYITEREPYPLGDPKGAKACKNFQEQEIICIYV